MKIIGVIPARYKSSRFPGKALADIHGKPMVWWVYQQAIKVKLAQALKNGAKIIVNQHGGNYVNEKAWAMCRQAEPFFSNLKKAGILWETGGQAAQKVNEIWDNVNEWWNQPKIQKARKEWAWNYARTSKNWRRDWIKVIWNL